LAPTARPFFSEEEVEVSTDDAGKVDCCLMWACEHEIEGEEGPWVVWCRDVYDVDVYCGVWMETGPSVGDCYLQGRKIEAKGGDDSAQRLEY
jgi:hypothetical protein